MASVKGSIRRLYNRSKATESVYAKTTLGRLKQSALELKAISHDKADVLEDLVQIQKHTILYLSGSKEPRTLVTSVPISIRRALFLDEGQKLDWKIIDDGHIMITTQPQNSENSQSILGV